MNDLKQITEEIREEDRQAAKVAYLATHFLAGCLGFVIGTIVDRVFS